MDYACGQKILKKQVTSVERHGQVEGKSVELDTGCSKTLSRNNLVPREKMLEGKAVAITCGYHYNIIIIPTCTDRC